MCRSPINSYFLIEEEDESVNESDEQQEQNQNESWWHRFNHHFAMAMGLQEN